MTDQPNTPSLPTPLNCLIGSIVAAIMTAMMYWMTSKIATTFALSPVNTSSTVAINIGTAVRTLVTGITALGTAVFAIISLGLVALAIKVAVDKTPSST
jgi:Protein of unknown function (DUF3082)